MIQNCGGILGQLTQRTAAVSRSISAENPTGAPGAGGMALTGSSQEQSRELGQGWKVSPAMPIEPFETHTLADIQGSGIIRHIWLTPCRQNWRDSILRIYWDGAEQPSVECPVGDFFCCGWNEYWPIASLPVSTVPANGMNCYWEMPFRSHCTITLTNLSGEAFPLAYQIDYSLEEVGEDSLYFHAQFRRQNPVPCGEPYTILDRVSGEGQYVGTYLAWGTHNNGWWGEGEIKFYMDDDCEFPTICGTGTEDYIGGSFNFDIGGKYQQFSNLYTGFQVLPANNLYRSQMRFGMYRWHLTDPVFFREKLRVTIQVLGWRSENRYMPLQDDVASVAFWYQTLPVSPFPPFPNRNQLEIV